MSTSLRQVALSRPRSILAAYARMARYYDYLFGPLLAPARAASIREVNRLPGIDVLEVGVGTGLALPHYSPDKRITGIDLSPEMLAQARLRATRLQLPNPPSLLEMDAQSTHFGNGQFDIAIAMFVASVVPNPRALLAEMRRIVKPGGTLLFVSHFARDNFVPAWWRRASDRVSAKLGWHADFRLTDIFDAADLERASITPLTPLGFFQLVELQIPYQVQPRHPFNRSGM